MKKIYFSLLILAINFTAAQAQSFFTSAPAIFADDVDDQSMANAHLDLNVSIYPNPSVGNFNVALSGFHFEKITLLVLDTKGRTVGHPVTENYNGKSNINFNLNHAAPGRYVIKVFNSKGLLSAKPFIIIA